MPVALVVVGPDAPGPDREPDDGPRRVVTVQTRAALELLESAAHLHDEQGPADEAEPGAGGVEDVVAGQFLGSGRGRHASALPAGRVMVRPGSGGAPVSAVVSR